MILITFGRVIDGRRDLSAGKSNPIFLIRVLLIFPTLLPFASRITPVPSAEVMFVAAGSAKYDFPPFTISIWVTGPLAWVQVVS